MKKIILVCLMFASSAAFAGRSVDAKIISVRVDSSGVGMVRFATKPTGTPPDCMYETYADYFSFNTSTNGGKALLSAALAAKATGSVVSAYGSGTCVNYNGVAEDLAYLVSQ